MVEARAPIVHTKALTKAYGEHVALNALDLQIEAGATGLLGANGAGKSTLLKMMSGERAQPTGFLFASRASARGNSRAHIGGDRPD